MLIITELPSEVLFHLFTFFKGKELAHLRLTNCAFRDLISLDTVWMEKCIQEFKIKSLEGWKVNTFYELYTKVLHKYGFLIGLWKAVMEPYGTMIVIQHTNGKLVGSELLAPCPPHIEKPMRKRLMFTIELNEEKVAESLCHMGPNQLSHKCNIFPEQNDENQAYFRCCVEAAHRNPGGMRRELEQFLMDESPEIEAAIFTGTLEILKKFRVLKKYESCFDLHRIILPAKENDAIIQPGLYKADYTIFGYELILVFYTDDKNKLIGKKVTGNPCIPADEVAFEVTMDQPIFLLAEHQQTLETIETRGYDGIPEGIHYKLLPEQDFLLPQDCEFEGKIPPSCAFRFHAKMNISPANVDKAVFMPSHLVVFSANSFALLAFQAKMLFTFLQVEETFL